MYFQQEKKSLNYPSGFLNSAIVPALNPEAYGQPKVKYRLFQCVDSFQGEYRMALQHSCPTSSNKKGNPNLENTCDRTWEQHQPLINGLEKLKCNQMKCLY